MNPFQSLLRSRKFLLLVLDTVVSLLTYSITQLAAPDFAEFALYFIGALQPVFVAIIVAISYEDGQAKRAGNHPYHN
jgi:hypothetical protein